MRLRTGRGDTRRPSARLAVGPWRRAGVLPTHQVEEGLIRKRCRAVRQAGSQDVAEADLVAASRAYREEGRVPTDDIVKRRIGLRAPVIGRLVREGIARHFAR